LGNKFTLGPIAQATLVVMMFDMVWCRFNSQGDIGRGGKDFELFGP